MVATSTATGSGVADPEGEVGMILGQQDLEHERKLSARVAVLPHRSPVRTELRERDLNALS
jgi:hypothetical protein